MNKRKITYIADDDLLEGTRGDGVARMRIYRPVETSIVLGRGSDAEVELNLEACRLDNLPITRRRGGGCAVVLDPGNVIVSVVLPTPGIGQNQEHFNRLSSWVIAGLERLGYPNIRQEGISDLVLGDQKIAGACMYRSKGLIYYTVTLLVGANLELIERYLTHPPREPAYRRGRPHRQFVRTLTGVASSSFANDVANDLGSALRLEELPSSASIAIV